MLTCQRGSGGRIGGAPLRRRCVTRHSANANTVSPSQKCDCTIAVRPVEPNDAQASDAQANDGQANDGQPSDAQTGPRYGSEPTV